MGRSSSSLYQTSPTNNSFSQRVKSIVDSAFPNTSSSFRRTLRQRVIREFNRVPNIPAKEKDDSSLKVPINPYLSSYRPSLPKRRTIFGNTVYNRATSLAQNQRFDVLEIPDATIAKKTLRAKKNRPNKARRLRLRRRQQTNRQPSRSSNYDPSQLVVRGDYQRRGFRSLLRIENAVYLSTDIFTNVIVTSLNIVQFLASVGIFVGSNVMRLFRNEESEAAYMVRLLMHFSIQPSELAEIQRLITRASDAYNYPLLLLTLYSLRRQSVLPNISINVFVQEFLAIYQHEVNRHAIIRLPDGTGLSPEDYAKWFYNGSEIQIWSRVIDFDRERFHTFLRERVLRRRVRIDGLRLLDSIIDVVFSLPGTRLVPLLGRIPDRMVQEATITYHRLESSTVPLPVLEDVRDFTSRLSTSLESNEITDLIIRGVEAVLHRMTRTAVVRAQDDLEETADRFDELGDEIGGTSNN